MTKSVLRRLAVILAVAFLVNAGVSFAVAAADLKQDVDEINAEVKSKQDRVDQLNAAISQYKAKIVEHEAAVNSLQNQLALLDNRIQEKQFAVERTKTQIDIANLGIENAKQQIQAQGVILQRRQAILGDMVRRIQEAQRVSVLDILMTRPSLSEFFSRLEEMKRVERDLSEATKSVRNVKTELEIKQKQLEDDRLALQERQRQLSKEQTTLEGDRSAKVSLVAATQSKEGEFQRILYELRQEQQSTASSIAELQDRLKERLDSIDTALARGDILLNWPIKVNRGVSAHFHDPSYPFRHLFEHPGTDLPTPVGTPVRAAAGGYVAWNRVGKQYGNYVMVVHPGGIATIYAHLSKFATEPDTYVERGDVIGYSGGRPGDAGAGLSTGPHLHFEVRQNGIPVNPENFLPDLD